jgi:hypothetical protein
MNRIGTLLLVVVGLTLGGVEIALAHGPMLDQENGRLSVLTPTSLIDGTPLYEDEFAFAFTNLGWQALPVGMGGGHLTPGSTIGMTVLDLGPKLKLSSPAYLFYHNGTSFADPGSALLRILGTTGVVTKTGANFTDLPIGTVVDATDFHDHLGVLLQNGSVGVYGLLMSNTTSAANVADSAPYYLALNNDLGPEGYNKFLVDLNATAIPEASTLTMAGLAMIATGIMITLRSMKQSA